MVLQEFMKKALRLGYPETIIPEFIRIIPDDVVFSAKMVAEYLDVSEETVRRWCRRNEIEHMSVGRYKIRGSDLKEFLFEKNKKRIQIKFPELFM